MFRSAIPAWVAFGLVPLLAIDLSRLPFGDDPMRLPGLTGIERGVLFFALPLLAAIAAPAIGRFADRSGRRGALLVAGTVLVMASGLIPEQVVLGPDTWLRILLATVGAHTVTVCLWALLADVAPPGRRGRVAMLSSAVATAGAPIALSVIGVLCLSTAVCSYRTGAMALAVILGIATLPRLMRVSTDRAGDPAAAPERVPSYGAELRRHPPGQFLPVYIVGVVGLTALQYLIMTAARPRISAPEQIAFLALAPVVGMVAGALLWARAIDRVGPRRAFAVTLLHGLVVSLVVPWARTPTLRFLCAAAAGAALGPAVAAAYTLVVNRADRRALGETVGYYVMAAALASIVTWPLGEAMRRAGDHPPVALLIPAFCLLLALLLLYRQREQPEVAPPGPVVSAAVTEGVERVR